MKRRSLAFALLSVGAVGVSLLANVSFGHKWLGPQLGEQEFVGPMSGLIRPIVQAVVETVRRPNTNFQAELERAFQSINITGNNVRKSIEVSSLPSGKEVSSSSLGAKEPSLIALSSGDSARMSPHSFLTGSSAQTLESVSRAYQPVSQAVLLLGQDKGLANLGQQFVEKIVLADMTRLYGPTRYFSSSFEGVTKVVSSATAPRTLEFPGGLNIDLSGAELGLADPLKAIVDEVSVESFAKTTHLVLAGANVPLPSVLWTVLLGLVFFCRFGGARLRWPDKPLTRAT